MIGPSRRALALLAAVWLVTCGVLGARHEAHEAHVVAANGTIVHASQLAADHHGSQSDVHALKDVASDSDACPIVSALHQAVSAQVARPHLVASSDRNEGDLAVPAVPTTVASSVYRFAPKTSPPLA